MAAVRSIVHPFREEDLDRATLWWREVDVALSAGRVVRARRFLRWILAARPEEEEAWLRLAELASSRPAQVAYLRRAYAFHPHSKRVQEALRQARACQLESRGGQLERRSIALCRLPGKAYNDSKEPARKSWSRLLRQWLASAAREGVLPLLNTPTRSQVAAMLPAWLAFFGPLLVYLLTVCSTVYNLDSAEFSAAAYVLGIVRATGYPLYLLLAKVFSLLLPVGEVAFRLNLMSALCAAGTVALLYRLLYRLTHQRAAALSASFLLAFSYYFWAQAVVAEVYALNTLLMAALLLLLIEWEKSRSDGLLTAIGLLYGLSFGNHMSTLLLAPGIIFFMFTVAGRSLLRPRRLLRLLLPFLAGLGVYLYLPLRYQARPAFNYAGHYDAQGNFVALDLSHPANLWWLISGKSFQGLMFGYSPAELVDQIAQAAYQVWGNFFGIALVPGLLGAWVQMRKAPRHFGLLGLIFGLNLAFFVNYRVVDKAVMFIPAYLVWAVWAGEGFNRLICWVGGAHRRENHSPAWAWGFAAMAIVTLVVNWPLVNVHGDTRARDRAEAALAHASRDAIILGWWTSVPPMQYLQLVENRRPDVLIINRFLIGADEMYSLIDGSLGSRPVYVMELDEGLVNVYEPIATGPMYELAPRRLADADR